ncbi:RhoGAP domain containing protein [Tritrichomonas foetus]|uniref:RhoGAP domain containing protein n=1 Tax=Tritrichomonas foetus TaxID=1144522 RepID=A0A1J4JP49_9EUKA|nr:RhoGAP domain containing protein [Tritrichomonas foetus]|eukprot:OHT00514.1 RhoGAP domain containing protein [Tritrichomonas foetus]
MTLADPKDGPHFFTKKLEEYQGKVPYIITDLIDEMEKLNSSQVEGIFRLSAQKSTVEKLCLMMDSGRVTDFEGFEEPHIIACALKRYIRELSLLDPLIGADIADDINTQVQCLSGDPKIYEAFKELIDKNPNKSRRNCLAVLMKFFNRITKDASVNRMEASNFAIVFAPSLFPRNDTVASGNSMKAIELMINDHDKIFSPEWSNEDVYMTDIDIEKMAEPEILEEDAVLESTRRQTRKASAIPFTRNNLVDILQLNRPDRPAPMLQ